MFMTTVYPALCQAQATGNRNDFNTLCKTAAPLVRGYAARLARLSEADLDDLTQEGLISLVRWVGLYNYLCPKCDFRDRDGGRFVRHCAEAHGADLQPKVSLVSWAEHSTIQGMLNARKKLFGYRRVYFLDSTVLERLEKGQETGAGTNRIADPEIVSINRESVRIILEMLKHENNRRVKAFIVAAAEHGSSAAYLYLVESGLCPTVKTACNLINYHRASGRLKDYQRAVL